MLDIMSITQLSAIVLLALAAVVFLNSIFERSTRKRLMRCPETGAVAFVGAEQISRGDGKASTLQVHSCEFWPERKDCARGCLARYNETAPGYRVRANALRPFEPPPQAG